MDVAHTTIYGWIVKYSKPISEYLQNVMPHLSTWFRADDIWVNVSGDQKYLFAPMDLLQKMILIIQRLEI